MTLAVAAIIAVALLAAGTQGPAAAPPKAPKGVILIVTDDQGYGDFSFQGNPVLRTKHLDALAAGSARLPTFYVNPVCAPTRASLMTGRYAYRTRVLETYLGRAMLEPAEVTLAETLRDAGFATGIFGKWHLGDCYPMRPQDQGFDEVLVHRGGGIGQPSDPIGAALGHWEVQITREGRYRIEIVPPGAPTAQRFVLRVQDAHLRGLMRPGEPRVVEGVRLQSGPARMEVELWDSGGVFGAHQVFVSRG